MTDWNKDIAGADKGKSVILATKCGKVIKSSWLSDESRWLNLSAKEKPIAWQPWPDHPHVADGGRVR